MGFREVVFGGILLIVGFWCGMIVNYIESVDEAFVTRQSQPDKVFVCEIQHIKGGEFNIEGETQFAISTTDNRAVFFRMRPGVVIHPEGKVKISHRAGFITKWETLTDMEYSAYEADYLQDQREERLSKLNEDAEEYIDLVFDVLRKAVGGKISNTDNLTDQEIGNLNNLLYLQRVVTAYDKGTFDSRINKSDIVYNAIYDSLSQPDDADKVSFGDFASKQIINNLGFGNDYMSGHPIVKNTGAALASNLNRDKNSLKALVEEYRQMKPSDE